jgi:lambda repressor-like predicted transcriptional regulator
VASFDVLHHFITNEEPPEDILSALKKSGVTVHIVRENGATII